MINPPLLRCRVKLSDLSVLSWCASLVISASPGRVGINERSDMYKLCINKQQVDAGVYDSAILSLLICICNRIGETEEMLRILDLVGIKYTKEAIDGVQV
jgi:hypothetical protein